MTSRSRPVSAIAAGLAQGRHEQGVGHPLPVWRQGGAHQPVGGRQPRRLPARNAAPSRVQLQTHRAPTPPPAPPRPAPPRPNSSHHPHSRRLLPPASLCLFGVLLAEFLLPVQFPQHRVGLLPAAALRRPLRSGAEQHLEWRVIVRRAAFIPAPFQQPIWRDLSIAEDSCDPEHRSVGQSSPAAPHAGRGVEPVP